MRTRYSLSSSSFFSLSLLSNLVSFILYNERFFFFFFFFFLFFFFHFLIRYFEGLRGSGRLATTFFFFSRVYLFHERDTGTIVRSFFSFFFFFNFLRLRVFNTVYSRGVNALTRWRAHPTSARLSCSPFSKLILDIISSCRLILSSYTFISGMYI